MSFLNKETQEVELMTNGLYVATWTVFSVTHTALDSCNTIPLLVKDILTSNKINGSKLGGWEENKPRTAEILEQCFQNEIFLIVISIQSEKNEILHSIYSIDQCCCKCVLHLCQYIPACHTNK